MRISKVIAENKASKAEVDALRESQQHGIQRQRKGRSKRSHMTLAAKAFTIDALCVGNMSCARWRDIVAAFGKHLVEGVEVDLNGASEWTCRKLMMEHDMVCLAHEKEELKKQVEKHNNLQFMCDISPILGSESHIKY